MPSREKSREGPPVEPADRRAFAPRPTGSATIIPGEAYRRAAALVGGPHDPANRSAPLYYAVVSNRKITLLKWIWQSLHLIRMPA
jgi:hypothetical protein